MFYGYVTEISDQAFRLLVIILGVGFPGSALFLKFFQDTRAFNMTIEKSYQQSKQFYDTMLSSLGLLFFALIIHLTIHMMYPTILVDIIIVTIFIVAVGVALFGARYFNYIEADSEEKNNENI